MILDGFQHHLARVLGTDERVAARLVETLLARVGSRSLHARACGFVLATTWPGTRLPRALRKRAVGAVVHRALEHPGDTLVLLGLQDPGADPRREGLIAE